MVFVMSGQELGRCGSTSARKLTSFSQTSSAKYRSFVYVAETRAARSGGEGQRRAVAGGREQ
jgi:hypothetical protein